MNPASRSLKNIIRGCYYLHQSVGIGPAQPFNNCHHLHPIVGGIGHRTAELFYFVLILDNQSPATWSRISLAGTSDQNSNSVISQNSILGYRVPRLPGQPINALI